MIFCSNECISAGSGEGEGWPDRCAARSTHAAIAFPPFGIRFKTLGGKVSPSDTGYLPAPRYLNATPTFCHAIPPYRKRSTSRYRITIILNRFNLSHQRYVYFLRCRGEGALSVNLYR